MSIHDVDKGHGRRLNPLPNTGDVKDQRDAHGTISANYTTDATDLTKQQGIHGGFLELVASVDALFPALTVGNAGAGLWNNDSMTQVAYHHALGYTPTIIVYLTNATNFILLPFTDFNTGVGVATLSIRQYSATVDANAVYFTTTVTTLGVSDTAPSLPARIYLLRQPPA